MELLGDVGHVEARFGPFGDSANLDTRYVHGLRRTCQRLKNHFGCTQWNSYVSRVMWKLVSVHLQIVQILTQYRCTICAKGNIGSENVLNALDGTPR
jgi:hypothetical protein